MKKTAIIASAFSILLSFVMVLAAFQGFFGGAAARDNSGVEEEREGIKVQNLSFTHDNISTYNETDILLRWLVPNVTTSDGAFCHILQGMHVGTTYIYTAKTDDSGEHCVFMRTNIKTGARDVMSFYESYEDIKADNFSSISGYADEIVVRSSSVNGTSYNYMYATTGKDFYSLTRMRVHGENLYFTGCFDTVNSEGKSIICTSVKWIKTEDEYHYFLLKSQDDYYVSKISVNDSGGSIESPQKVHCYKLFTTEHKSAVFSQSNENSETITGFENWTHNGFEYDAINNFLYAAYFNDGYNRQSAIVTFSLKNVITDESLEANKDMDIKIYPTKLSFLVSEKNGSYFEIESCGFRTGQGTSGDASLYFSANSDDDKEGIYSLSYTRHTEEIENLVGDDTIVYTVEYMGNGNTDGKMESTTHITGIYSSLRKNAFLKNGYSFAGWYFYRKSDGAWVYEDKNGNINWKTNPDAFDNKYLGADEISVYNLAVENNEIITCVAVWTQNSTDNMFAGNTPIDLGTDFYGKLRIGDLYATNKNNALVGEKLSEDKSQLFRFVRRTDGSYTLFAYDENTAFDVSGGMYIESRNVGLYENNNTDAQKFFIYFIDGKFYIRTYPSTILLGINEKTNNIELIGEGKSLDTAFEILKYSFDGYKNSTDEYNKNYGEYSVAFIKNPATGKLMTANEDSLLFDDAIWDESQKWFMSKKEDGSYSFVSAKTGKAVTVIGGEMTYGGDIDLETVNGGMSQSFYLHNASDGYTYIKPVYTSYLFDMDTNNFDVHTYPYGDGEIQKNAQRFEIISSACCGKSPVDFESEFSGYVYTPVGKMITDDGEKILATDSAFSANQLFTFEYDEFFEAYKIKSSCGKVVSVYNSLDENGTKLTLEEDEGLPSQRFYIYNQENYYFIKSVFSNKLFDLDTGDDTTLQLYGEEVTQRRQFTIVKVTKDGKAPVDLGVSFTAKIKSSDYGMYLHPSYSSLSGKSDGFLWTFTRQTNGSYIIKNSSTNAVWEVLNGSVEYGTTIRSYDGRGLLYQNFFIYESDNGYIFQPCISAGAVTYDKENNCSTVEKIAEKGQVFYIIRPEDEPTTLLLNTNSNYSIDGMYLIGVSEKTKGGNIISSFKNEGVVIHNQDGNEISANDFAGTGFEVCLVKDGEILDRVTILIIGDVDGNGEVDSTDYLRIKQYFLQSYDLPEIFRLASDVDGSGEVDSTDYLKIKSHFLGTYNIYA